MTKGKYFYNNESYTVEFDDEEVINLMDEIIEKVSIIKHYDYIGVGDPKDPKNFKDNFEIRNLASKVIGKDKNGRIVYHFVYDEYEKPYLASLLLDLVFLDFNAIPEIINPDYSKEYIPLKKRIDELIEKIKNEKDVNKQIEYTEELKQELIAFSQGDLYIPIAKYYTKALKLMNIQKEELTMKLNK